MNFVIRNSEGTFVAEGDYLDDLLAAAKKFEAAQKPVAANECQEDRQLTPLEQAAAKYAAAIDVSSNLAEEVAALRARESEAAKKRYNAGAELSKLLPADGGVVFGGYFYRYVGGGHEPARTKVVS